METCVAWLIIYKILTPWVAGCGCRSLGVVSGMTASGGAVGAIVTNRLFFSGARNTIEEAISLTGGASLVCTLPMALVHFPRHGGMFCGPSTTAGGDDEDDDGDDAAAANDDHGDYMLLK